MPAQPDDTNVRIRIWGDKLVIVIPKDRADRAKALGRRVLREPFTARAWSELLYLVVGTPLAFAALAFIVLTLVGGLVLAITFIGIVAMAFSIRGARGLGGWQRGLARWILHDEIENPDAFEHRPGLFGWLQASLRDRVGWRAVAYFLAKVPLSLFAVYAAISIWWDAVTSLIQPLVSSNGGPPVFGLVINVFQRGGQRPFDSGYNFDNGYSFAHGVGIFLSGLIFLFAAPWAVRSIIYLDRLLRQSLLAPDSTAIRVRSLEQARAQTVDASAATLRRIERDLHDGTQAQLVALAMRLGMAKEKLESGETADLEQVRQLVDDAHKGAKEAIVELRDLARGIHPPALDVGLEGALATLAARSTVPTECTVTMSDRPTPAIESIAYFCVAELLANVAQHAQASRATINATQSGAWLRLVVRDDGVGRGAALQPGHIVKRPGRTDRPGARRGRAAALRQPRRRPYSRHRGSSPSCLRQATAGRHR